MAHILLTYSSLTGNTRMVAEAIHKALPEGTLLCPLAEAPSPVDFAWIITGFWTHRGGPDPATAAYMQRIQNRDVAFFGTLAAYPDSDHGRGVIARAEELLAGNRLLGSFLCQGKLSPERMDRILSGKAANKNHPLTEERKTRVLEAAKHPDARDLNNAAELFRGIAERFQQARPTAQARPDHYAKADGYL